MTAATHPLRVVVLVSGEGTNLQALIDSAENANALYEIVAVASDKQAARGLERARRAAIDTIYIDPRIHPDRAAFDRSLAEAIEDYAPELLVLAGFMRILSADFVNRFAGRILNIHPSLLPEFKGLETHRRVLEAGGREHGATVHFVTAELDDGPAVIQYRLPVHESDTEESLSARVHVGEHIILPRAVELFAARRLRFEDGRVTMDNEILTAPLEVIE